MNDSRSNRHAATLRLISILFILAALYDGGLGVAFLLASDHIFGWLNVVPPNHPGYVQFSAALLLIFAIMFSAIAINPDRNRNLIIYGILLKVSYCGVVAYHWLSKGVPYIWKPFFVFDLVFLALFIWAFMTLRGQHSLRSAER